ncbi:MAG: Fic family protein [Candidatus Saccharimonadales bacterium]
MNTPNQHDSLSESATPTPSAHPLYPQENPEALTPLLALADTLKREIDTQKVRLHPESDLWPKILEKMRVDWTYHSNAIEGSTLSRGDTLFFLQEGLTVEGKPFKDFLDARNHAEAIDLLFDVVANARPISEGLIKEINALLLSGISHTPAQTPTGQPVRKPVYAGQYKRLPNHVLQQDGSLHQYVLPEQVSTQMQTLVTWINAAKPEIHPIVIAGVAHYHLVRIHPFDDGNGRGARILMNLILLKAGFFPAIIRREVKRTYLEALGAADQGDIVPFLSLIVSQLIETLRAVQDDLELF